MKFKLFISMAFLIVLIGCAPNTSPTEAKPTSTQPSTIVLTQIVPNTPDPTTTISAPLPTWTPLPTLMVSDAKVMFKDWLKGTATCLFPCWAGIVPGETSWDEAIHTLNPVLTLHTAKYLGKCRFGPCRYLAWQYELEGSLYGGYLYSKDNIVYAMALEGDIPQEYTLHEIFIKYGQPTQILIHTNPYTYAGEPPQLDLVILYAKSAFAVKYIWQAETKDGDIVACGMVSGFMLGIVAIDEDQWTSLEISQTGSQLDNGATGDGGLRPLAEVSDTTINTFYQRVLENNNSFCVVTPVSYWE